MTRGTPWHPRTKGNLTVSTATAHQPASQVTTEAATEPFAALVAQLGDIVPIPMPPLAHPAGEQAHPWAD